MICCLININMVAMESPAHLSQLTKEAGEVKV